MEAHKTECRLKRATSSAIKTSTDTRRVNKRWKNYKASDRRRRNERLSMAGREEVLMIGGILIASIGRVPAQKIQFTAIGAGNHENRRIGLERRR